jgi:trimeric autotransporter adhesin
MTRTLRLTCRLSLLSFVLLGLTISLIKPFPDILPIKFEGTASAQAIIPGPAIEGTIFAVTASNNLISFNQASPSAIISAVAITGLQSGEVVQGIDFRPRTGQLFALGSTSRVYTINPMTGAATMVGASPLATPISGTSFGFDFNPVPDLIRVVSDTNTNLRLNPNDGTLAGTDTALAFAMGDPNAGQDPNVVASAYTNNFDGSTSTSLYGIDSNLDTLVLQGSLGGAPTSPNTGQLTTVGLLNVNTTDQVGFDITNPGGIAFASLTPAGGTISSLYTINLTTGAATLVGPIGVTDTIRDIAAVVRVETIFALTAGNNLLTFTTGTPGTIASSRPITGLAAGENLLGIDFRPATGQLFATSSMSRVYTVNTATGAATPVGGAPLATALNGASFGFDFNPVPDLIRIVSDQRQNLRVNPNTGAIQGVDGTLAFAAGDPNAAATPNVTGAAYTNNNAGATSTTLYVIDSNLDALLLQGSAGGTPVSPNTGQLTTVGALGVDGGDQIGFDIATLTNAAFASLTPAGSTASSLYRINLNTGAATLIGAIGSSETIRDIAIGLRVEIVFAATNSNRLISFNALAPGRILSTAVITGLQDETIIGLDFRPATGQLFAIGSSSRIYLVNPLTGVATQVGTGITNPQFNGAGFGFDFNPVPDRIRVVSTATHNLRFVPDTGASAGQDPAVAYAPNDRGTGQPSIVGAAYDNSFRGTASTTLYVIDSGFDTLVRQGSPGGAPVSPNTGQLFTVGSLGVDTNEMVGFDIADVTNNAYASLTVAGTSQLFTINLITGAATLIGNIAGGEIIRGIAVQNNVIPSATPAGISVVNAASFTGDNLAPDSLVAIFGQFQTEDGRFYSATSQPMPTSLGGVNVKVDGADAQILIASNGQINVMLPSLSSDGLSTVVVANSDGTTDTGTINMVRSSTGIFTASSNGKGTAAAVWTVDGVTFLPVSNPDGSEREMSAGTASQPTFLILYTTGLRNAQADNRNDEDGMAEAVKATILDKDATVTWAGPAPGLSGADQVNIIIPPELARAGSVPIRLTAAGRTSNVVTVSIGQ